MGLSEKINYEFKRFYLDQMRTSKENIFAHSHEIEWKKRLAIELLNLQQEIDGPAMECLLLQENLLESVYCFCQDLKGQGAWSEEWDEKSAVKEWASFLTEARRRAV